MTTTRLTTKELRSVPCLVCNAAPGEPCLAPTSTSRREVKWHHLLREEDAQEKDQ